MVLAVLAVMLVALSLFLLGGFMAVKSVWAAWQSAFDGELEETQLTVDFLKVVSVMLKGVVFYLVSIGMYSLFIAPLNLAIGLGIETLNDLEAKVVNIVIVILAVTFLERFIRWDNPKEMIQYGVAMALSVSALVLFQFYNHRAREDQRNRAAAAQERMHSRE